MNATSSGRLAGRVAVVTGAGRGIGAAVAKAFAAEGAHVMVSDAGVAVDGSGTDAGPAAEVAEEIVRAGGTAVSDSTNVTDYDACAAMIERGLTYGRLDVLVNAAGILRDRMIFNLSEADWDVVIDVHLKGTFNTTRHAASYWREHKDEGDYRLINFTSGSGLFGAPTQPNYAAGEDGHIRAYLVMRQLVVALRRVQQRGGPGGRHAHDDESAARGLRSRHHGAGQCRAARRLPGEHGFGLAQRAGDLGRRWSHRARLQSRDRARGGARSAVDQR